MDQELRLRVKLRNPVPGVMHALQLGPTATRTFSPPVKSSAKELVFEATVRVVAARAGAALSFRGPAVHGPSGDRFLYICSGQHVGHSDSEWNRRLKVRVESITPALAKSAASKPDSILEAVLPGRANDGGPSCATVEFISGWKLARA
jgi:hypothetical protein